MKIGNLVIFGDSYSAYEGYIAEGCNPCYGPTEKRDNYRIAVEDMWWHKLCSKTDAVLIHNAAASGSAISYTGWSGYNRDYSFIGRFEKTAAKGVFKENRVDTLIFFGGTNDSWIPAPLGEVKHENITDDDKKCVLPAICYIFEKIKNTLPDTQVLVLINDILRDEIADTLEHEALRNGFKPLRLRGIEKEDGHPNIKGMTQISDQIIDFLEDK